MSGSTTQHTETTGRPQPTRNTGQKIAYAFGNLGQAAFYNTMSTFFITFVTTALFIDVDKTLAKRLIAVITGLVVVIRIAEIFLDPLLGNLVDNTNTRWGRFRPWQFIGGIVPGILLIMVFTGLFGLVDVNTGVFMVLFVIVFILLDVIYSLRDISYWGMIPAISSDSHERSTYTALGAFTGSIGYNGVTVIVVPVVSWFTWKFTGQWEQGRTGWAAFAIIIAVLGLLTAWSVAFGTRENKAGCAPRPRPTATPSRRSRPSPRTTSSCGWPSAICCTPWPTSPPPACFFISSSTCSELRTASPSPASSRSSPDWAPRPSTRCSTAASRAAGCTPPAWRS